ncbi:hypothetical protein ACRAWF_38030 [Streptomyces sp. L7]
MQEYNDRVGKLRLWKRQQFETWATKMAAARTDRQASRTTLSERIDQLQHERQNLNQEYRRRRVLLFREFVMRAWMIPMLLGSVDDAHRDEARERLASGCATSTRSSRAAHPTCRWPLRPRWPRASSTRPTGANATRTRTRAVAPISSGRRRRCCSSPGAGTRR